MAIPEHLNPNRTPLSQKELTTQLDELTRQLELADDNENPIERFFKRDELLERQVWLQAEIAEIRRLESGGKQSN